MTRHGPTVLVSDEFGPLISIGAAVGDVAELREAAEAVIAFVPLHTGEPLTGWQRNSKERRQAAIARLRDLLARLESADSLDVERLSIAMNRAYVHGTGTAEQVATEYAALREDVR